jgi:signal peptidase I
MEKKRKAWLSATLSGTIPGLGQLYNGNLRLAVILGVISVLFYSTVVLLCLSTFHGLIFTAVLATVLSVYAAVQAWMESKRLGVMVLGPLQKKRFYLIYLLLVMGAPELLDFVTPSGDHYGTFSIPSESMMPNLFVGDYVMADTWAFAKRAPEHGEVFVFLYPKNHDLHYVKRVIGVPGDVIELRHNELFVNNEKVQDQPGDILQGDDGLPYREYLESYGGHQYTIRKAASEAYMARANFGPVTVPADQYFAMGDNRDRSSDSRVWGFVNKSELVGKMLYRYFSIDTSMLRIRWDRIGTSVP